MENEKQTGGSMDEKVENKTSEKKEGNNISGKRIVLLLLLGVLIGIFFKTQVFSSAVVGYNDSRLESLKSDFDYEEYEKKKAVAEKEAAEKADIEGGQVQGGGQVESAPASGGQCGN
jgi:hypothetical protein